MSKYPKDKLLKCEVHPKWDGYYVLKMLAYQDNFPDGAEYEYEESALQIFVNLKNDEWEVACDLPVIFKEDK